MKRVYQQRMDAAAQHRRHRLPRYPTQKRHGRCCFQGEAFPQLDRPLRHFAARPAPILAAPDGNLLRASFPSWVSSRIRRCRLQISYEYLRRTARLLHTCPRLEMTATTPPVWLNRTCSSQTRSRDPPRQDVSALCKCSNIEYVPGYRIVRGCTCIIAARCQAHRHSLTRPVRKREPI